MEAQKEIEKHRVLVDGVIAAGGATADWIEVVSPHWNTYVSLAHGYNSDPVKEKRENEERNLQEYYKKIKEVKVVAKKKKGPGGSSEGVIVSGLKNLEKF